MRVLWLVLAVSVAGCRCGSTVSEVAPSLKVSPAGVDFGAVKVRAQKAQALRLEALTRAPVVLSSLVVEGPGAAAFLLGTAPGRVEALASEAVTVTFTPSAAAAFTASLVVASNDPDHPTIRVALVGEGAEPVLEVTPDCAASRGCTGTATVTPLALDFGAEPVRRATPVDASRLPMVVVVNAGTVPLSVTRLAVTGPDAAAFAIEGAAALPLLLEAAEGRNVPIRFTPQSEQQAQYVAALEIGSDDPAHPQVTVDLTGTLRPNQAPTVCANLVRVVPPPQGDGPRDYATAGEWASLLVPPAGGYDLTSRRDVRPGDLVLVSALSDAADGTACTTDAEDGRGGLTWQWRLVRAPAGAAALPIGQATSPQAQLRPVVTGEYELELVVTDSQQASTTVRLRFAVAAKEDLVAQLQWLGAADVDLDLHLVRPSAGAGLDPFAGAFAFFEAGPSGRTSGDLNGYAQTVLRAAPGAGYNFDWGQAGAADDPVLNVDDTGDGELLENVSLNFPEHDPACATASCTYRVLVHAFNDARAPGTPAPCTVGGACADGDPCGCPAGQRCVADSAPIGDAGVGAGKCYQAPQPVVRLFFRGQPTAAAVIPLDSLVPPDEVVLGAPCHLWHVADVAWPAQTAIGSLPDGGTPAPVVTAIGADGTGRIVTPRLARFGWRQAGGSLQCSPDVTLGGVAWYSRQP